MRNDYFEKAIKNDLTGVLKPVLDIAYSLEPKGKLEVIDVAIDVNKKLGYDLFDDLHYPRLIRDFALVARGVQTNAVEGGK